MLPPSNVVPKTTLSRADLILSIFHKSKKALAASRRIQTRIAADDGDLRKMELDFDPSGIESLIEKYVKRTLRESVVGA